jgi:hypothetical protein
MAMDLATCRKLVELDPHDALSRFALGRKLFEECSDQESMSEAAEHLGFANECAPEHLATYHILGQVLIRLNRTDEARRVLSAGIERVGDVGEGMGRDLGPAMTELIESIS